MAMGGRGRACTLMRLLNVEGVGAHRSLFLKSAYVLKRSDRSNSGQTLDGDSRRFLDVVGGRVVDGARLHARVAALRGRDALAELFQEAPFDGVPAADRPKVARRRRMPGSRGTRRRSARRTAASAWVPERIEYEFAVSGRTSDGEVVLAAPEYLEGHLDWFSFVARPGTSLGARARRRRRSTTAFLPAPVSYRGMPSPRFWEFEDANVNFAKVEANPEDLARLLLVKFALEYGNDWFLVPLEMDVGSLCQVRSLIVTNTFGERMLDSPYDRRWTGASSPWRVFALSHDSQHLFFLPPVLGPSLQSAPIEDVLFLRDEMANVAWAVERVVQSPAGRSARSLRSVPGGSAAPGSGGAGRCRRTTAEGTVAYRLGTTVPDYWIPLLPVQQGTSIRLKRGVLPEFEGRRHRRAARSARTRCSSRVAISCCTTRKFLAKARVSRARINTPAGSTARPTCGSAGASSPVGAKARAACSST